MSWFMSWNNPPATYSGKQPFQRSSTVPATLAGMIFQRIRFWVLDKRWNPVKLDVESWGAGMAQPREE